MQDLRCVEDSNPRQALENPVVVKSDQINLMLVMSQVFTVASNPPTFP